MRRLTGPLDEHGLMRDFSDAAERMFGWTAREVAERSVRTLVPEPYRAAHDGCLERYYLTGEKAFRRSARQAALASVVDLANEAC